MKSVCVSAGGANGGAGGGGAGGGDAGSSAGAADVGAAPQAGGIPEATSQMVTVARMRYQRHLGRREVVALGRRACAGARRSAREHQQQARLLHHLGWFRISRTTCWPIAASVSTFRCRASSRRLTRTGPSSRALRRRSSRSRSPCPCQRSFATSGVCVGISRYRRKISREILKSRTFLGRRRFARKNKAIPDAHGAGRRERVAQYSEHIVLAVLIKVPCRSDKGRARSVYRKSARESSAGSTMVASNFATAGTCAAGPAA